MKRVLCLALCTVLLLSMMPAIGTSASGTMAVCCKAPVDWNRCMIYWWGSSVECTPWPGELMVQDPSGQWVYEVPLDATGLLFHNDEGFQTPDTTLPASNEYWYDVEAGGWIGWIPPVTTYYVAGSEGLCGEAWNPRSENNRMTAAEDGTYYKTYTNVPAGSYELKVTVGSWALSWGAANIDANYELFVDQDGSTVTVFFDPATKLVSSDVSNTTRRLIVYAPADWSNVYAYVWDPEDLGLWPGTLMERIGDVYELRIPNTATNLILSTTKEDGTRKQSRECTLEANDMDVTVILREQDLPTLPPDPDPVIPRKLKVFVPEDWTQIRAYTWNPESFGRWPGTAMEQVFDRYDLQISDTMTNLVLNGEKADGSFWKSTDITLENNGQNVVIDVDADGICSVSYEPRFDGTFPESLALVGEGIPGIGTWDPADPMGQMPKSGTSPHRYETTLKCPAGTTLVFKISKYGEWTQKWNFGSATVQLGQAVAMDCGFTESMILTVEEDCTLRFVVSLADMLSGGYATLLVEQVSPLLPDPSPQRKLTVYAPANWSQVRAYTWEPESLGTFPGTALVQTPDAYELMVPTTMTNLVIGTPVEGTGGFQIVELVLEPGTEPVFITIYLDRGQYVPCIHCGDSPLSNYRVVGNTDWMGNWDPNFAAGQMAALSSGLYQKKFENVAPGCYEFKITQNGTWNDAIGEEGGSNFRFTVLIPCDVTVLLNPQTGEVTVALDSGFLCKGDVAGNGLLNMGDVAKLYSHIRSTNQLTDAAALSNGDLNGDAKINMGDVAKLYARIRSTANAAE